MTITEFLTKSKQSAADYERDLYAWAFEQAALLRAGQFKEIDIANIAEELETLGRSEFRAYASAYRVLLLHMLKWDHQPDKRSRSWWASIAVQRGRLQEVLADNPSLNTRRNEAVARGYREARLRAAEETGLTLASFPETCPYDEQAMASRPFELD
jgi:hypothetical protein